MGSTDSRWNDQDIMMTDNGGRFLGVLHFFDSFLLFHYKYHVGGRVLLLRVGRFRDQLIPGKAAEAEHRGARATAARDIVVVAVVAVAAACSRDS